MTEPRDFRPLYFYQITYVLYVHAPLNEQAIPVFAELLENFSKIFANIVCPRMHYILFTWTPRVNNYFFNFENIKQVVK